MAAVAAAVFRVPTSLRCSLLFLCLQLLFLLLPATSRPVTTPPSPFRIVLLSHLVSVLHLSFLPFPPTSCTYTTPSRPCRSSLSVIFHVHTIQLCFPLGPYSLRWPSDLHQLPRLSCLDTTPPCIVHLEHAPSPLFIANQISSLPILHLPSPPRLSPPDLHAWILHSTSRTSLSFHLRTSHPTYWFCSFAPSHPYNRRRCNNHDSAGSATPFLHWSK